MVYIAKTIHFPEGVSLTGVFKIHPDMNLVLGDTSDGQKIICSFTHLSWAEIVATKKEVRGDDL